MRGSSGRYNYVRAGSTSNPHIVTAMRAGAAWRQPGSRSRSEACDVIDYGEARRRSTKGEIGRVTA